MRIHVSSSMDKFCERLCSKLVVAVVSLLIISVFLTVYFVFVPFEYYHKGLYHFLFLFVFGIYLFVNVLYHYYQSCFKSPGFAPKVSGSPLCWQCGHYKPSNAHHCTECNRCVLRMDHHCVFIGQCVGLYNHRHFFQFVGFLGLSCLTAVLSGTNTFWYNVAMIPLNNNELAFCNVVSDDYFLKSLICWDRRGLIVTQLVVCTYSLCLTGMGVGFLFFTWNAILISADTTHVDSTKNGTWTAMFRSMKNFSNVRQNWASFLGLNSRRRSFFWHILLPSSHAPIVGDPSIEKRLSTSMLRLLVLLLIPLVIFLHNGDALTINSHMGSLGGDRIGSILNFDISSKSEMHCFYETIKDRANLRMRATAVNGASNEVHMRISSPNEIFSEWFQGVGKVEYMGEATEGGDYEFCVTSKVNYGDLRINVELFSYVQDDIQKAVQEHVASNAIRDDMTKRIDQLFNNTWTSFYAMRYSNLMIRRDEAAQESNLFIIDVMSSVQTALFLIVAVSQVYTVRKMFKVDGSRIRI